MTDISIQFYALPEEALALTKAACERFALYIVGMQFFPFRAVEMEKAELAGVFTACSPIKRLAFTLSKPVLPVAHELEFSGKNPDHLRLQIGRRTSEGLEESWLTARTGDQEAISAWRKIANSLREMTLAGVLGVNRRSGATAVYRSTRYTEGAKLLEGCGIPMIPPQGLQGPRILLGLTGIQSECPGPGRSDNPRNGESHPEE